MESVWATNTKRTSRTLSTGYREARDMFEYVLLEKTEERERRRGLGKAS